VRLSPITIPYRVFQRSSSVLVLAFVVTGSEMSRAVGGPAVVGGLVAAAVLALVGYELAYYRRFEYEFTDDTLDIRSGVFGRRERELPYHRIQNVDVTRNAIPRLLGIAAVGFETAGGSQTEGSIRYVSAQEARRLQREIQRRKQAADGTDDDHAEEELFALVLHELGLVGALSFDARVLGVLTLLGPGSVPFFSEALSRPPVESAATASLLAVGLGIAAWLLGIGVAVVNYYGFRLTRVDEELRYERGLFRRYSGSVPYSKVQSVTVEDNPLKRLFGYATLTVETAGYSPDGDSRGSEVAVPIARRDRVDTLAAEVEPFGDPDFERPPGRIRRRYAVRYLLAVGALVAVAYALTRYVRVGLPWYWIGALLPLVAAAAHLKWRHRGYWLGDDHVVLRNGVWSRSMTAVPYYRVQTVIDSRTLFQRRWDVATVTVDTAGSSSLFGGGAAAVDVAVPAAVELRETLTERLQDALSERRRELDPRMSGGESTDSSA